MLTGVVGGLFEDGAVASAAAVGRSDRPSRIMH